MLCIAQALRLTVVQLLDSSFARTCAHSTSGGLIASSKSILRLSDRLTTCNREVTKFMGFDLLLGAILAHTWNSHCSHGITAPTMEGKEVLPEYWKPTVKLT